MKYTLLILLFICCRAYAQTYDDFVKRGNDKVKAGDQQGAIAEYGNAINLDGANPNAYFYRANSYANINDNARGPSLKGISFTDDNNSVIGKKFDF